ncbi:MAG: topoisomerase DNA-binding C4 zinc finger domain-containing protein, partial [Desulfovibrionaceae bacterium]|nr:topoisomerase DNA-binding C4 zinc finger domain-containing protein [Desulfovibrionaceae bacterium]
LGSVVVERLTGHFSRIMDVGFTALMESALDRVADGEQNWARLLADFSAEFNPELAQASKTMNSVKTGLLAGLPCPECGKDLLIKFGKAGPFLACSGYPDCRCTSNFTRDGQGQVKIEEGRKEEKPQIMGVCPECGKELILKKARTGSRFISCSGYPSCKHAESFSTGVPCPKCPDGLMAEKSSRRGKIFYSCSRYPACDYATWDYPVPGPCPACAFPILTRKMSKTGPLLACPNKPCKYKQALEE